MRLSQLNDGKYLASDDYTVGKILPEASIASMQWEDVAVTGSQKTNRRVVVYFEGVKKGWVMNKNVAREIARKAGLPTEEMDKTWIGARISLVVVGDVRRPNGTKGNAFRVHSAKPKA